MFFFIQFDVNLLCEEYLAVSDIVTLHVYISLAKTVQTKFDASTLHGNQALAAETQMVDDGSGTTQVCEYISVHIYISSFVLGKRQGQLSEEILSR